MTIAVIHVRSRRKLMMMEYGIATSVTLIYAWIVQNDEKNNELLIIFDNH